MTTSPLFLDSLVQSNLVDLLAQVDFGFAQKVCRLANPETFDYAIWRSLSFGTLLAQAALFTMIVGAMASEGANPGQDLGLLREMLACLFASASLAMISRPLMRLRCARAWCSSGAFQCAAIFERMFSETERLLLDFEHRCNKQTKGIAAD